MEKREHSFLLANKIISISYAKIIETLLTLTHCNTFIWRTKLWYQLWSDKKAFILAVKVIYCYLWNYLCFLSMWKYLDDWQCSYEAMKCPTEVTIFAFDDTANIHNGCIFLVVCAINNCSGKRLTRLCYTIYLYTCIR